MYDERHFPYEYECVECGTTATVTREDVQGVNTAYVAKAVEYVMEQRGWSLSAASGAICPDCTAGLTSD